MMPVRVKTARRSIIMRRNVIRCGRASCHCADGGDRHGPYWYAYWKSNGRARSIYIGKQLLERRAIAHVAVLENEPISLVELQELASVPHGRDARPIAEVRKMIDAALHYGSIRLSSDGTIRATMARRWLKATGAQGFVH